MVRDILRAACTAAVLLSALAVSAVLTLGAAWALSNRVEDVDQPTSR